MKLLYTFLIIVILTIIAQMYLPWYVVVLIAAIVAYISKVGPGKSFLVGFLAIALVWGLYACILSAANDGILAGKIGQLFGGLSASLLILITAGVGGLVGGMGALTGSLARRL